MYTSVYFASMILHARKEKKLTQTQAAQLAGISLRWYQRVEKGDAKASFEVCVRIAKALDIDLNDVANAGKQEKVLYYPFEQYINTPELGRYIGYGIRALRHGPEGWSCEAEIADISCDGSFVERLAQLCARLELAPIHLYDVVEDAINV